MLGKSLAPMYYTVTLLTQEHYLTHIVVEIKMSKYGEHVIAQVSGRSIFETLFI